MSLRQAAPQLANSEQNGLCSRLGVLAAERSGEERLFLCSPISRRERSELGGSRVPRPSSFVPRLDRGATRQLNNMQGCITRAGRITCSHACNKQAQQQHQLLARRPSPLSRRQALHGVLLGGALLTVVPQRPALADGLESVELPPLPSTPKFIDDLNKQNQAALDAAEESFQNSELLKTLRERSEANRSK